MSYLTGLERVAQNIGNSNLFVNGGFEIWQKGTTFSSPANFTYTADRWFAASGSSVGALAFTVAQEPGAGNVDNGNYSLNLTVTNAGTAGNCSVANYVENYIYYRGKIISASVRVKTTMTKVRLQLDTGIAGAFSSYHSGSGNWETLTITYAVESNASALGIYVGQRNEGGGIQTGTFYADSAMMVVGTEPQAFVPLVIADDLARCQRYYELSGSYNPVVALESSSSSTARIVHPFKVTKASTPTITMSLATAQLWQSPTQGTGSLVDTANYTATTASVNVQGCSTRFDRNASQTTYNVLELSYSYTAEVT